MLQFSNVELTTRALILDKWEADLILGLDFLKELAVAMDFKDGHTSIHGRRIYFHDADFDSSDIGLNQTGSNSLQ